jgi:haloalkane dehalogenase
MESLRTPDDRFNNLDGYTFEPNYFEIDDLDGGTLRVHYVDEGDKSAKPVLLMHGEPSWSYLYRKMIPVIVNRGFRAIAPDLVGFGRSDKPSSRYDYTYARHVNWMSQLIFDKLKLSNITLVCQDWGGLIGLRLLSLNPDMFDRVVAANTGLPTGNEKMSEAFEAWKKFSQEVPQMPIGKIISGGCLSKLSEEVVAAYDAPFPDETFKEGARIFPSLVPTSPDDPAAADQAAAWEVLKSFNKPFMTAFSDGDPITKGGYRILQELIPGAKQVEHKTVEGGGHFLQEDKGEKLAEIVCDFIEKY